MQYTKQHSAWIRVAMLLSAGFVVFLPVAELAPTPVLVPGGFGDRRATANTAGVTWDPPRPGTTSSNSDCLAPTRKLRSAAGAATAATRPRRYRPKSVPRRRYGPFRRALRPGFSELSHRKHQPLEWTLKLMMQEPPRLPVDDYSAALRDAVSWLGERYLLAVPVTRNDQAPRYLPQGRGWYERLHDKR
jgi:hypothetical protein